MIQADLFTPPGSPATPGATPHAIPGATPHAIPGATPTSTPGAIPGKRETSRAAAQAILPKTGTLRRKVYDFIAWNRGFGATDGEIQATLNMAGSTERPRRKELEDAGWVRDSGRTRKTGSGHDAIVWLACVPMICQWLACVWMICVWLA